MQHDQDCHTILIDDWWCGLDLCESDPNCLGIFIEQDPRLIEANKLPNCLGCCDSNTLAKDVGCLSMT